MKISIVTAYYNRKELFKNTLDSIVKSNFKDIEVIAVDDCSDDSHRIEDLIVDYPFLKVISYTIENLKKEEYFSFSCYSLDRISTENIHSILNNNFVINKPITHDGDNGWYNHSIYRPVGYHFCSAIHKENLDDLGGFDERYADGIAFDDDELLVRINKKDLKIKIIDTHSVLHQWHYSSNNYQKYNASELINKNRMLLHNTTMKENTYKVNQNNYESI